MRIIQGQATQDIYQSQIINDCQNIQYLWTKMNIKKKITQITNLSREGDFFTVYSAYTLDSDISIF